MSEKSAVSMPSPPISVSLPRPPTRRSSPPLPFRTLSFSSPVIESSDCEPVTFSKPERTLLPAPPVAAKPAPSAVTSSTWSFRSTTTPAGAAENRTVSVPSPPERKSSPAKPWTRSSPAPASIVLTSLLPNRPSLKSVPMTFSISTRLMPFTGWPPAAGGASRIAPFWLGPSTPPLVWFAPAVSTSRSTITPCSRPEKSAVSLPSPPSS